MKFSKDSNTAYCLFLSLMITYMQSMRSSISPKKSPKSNNDDFKCESVELSFIGMDQLILMMEVHKKIFVFRDIMDLVPLQNSASLRQVRTTLDTQCIFMLK